MKEIIDHILRHEVVTEWHHEENSHLTRLVKQLLGNVPNFDSLRSFRSRVNCMAKQVQTVGSDKQIHSINLMDEQCSNDALLLFSWTVITVMFVLHEAWCGSCAKYQQITLHSDSWPLTTLSTHVGLFQYKRLNFGLSCAAEIFQRKVGEQSVVYHAWKNISDDIYVGGVNNDTHDLHLKQVFHQFYENWLTINLLKCQFRVCSSLAMCSLERARHLIQQKLNLFKVWFH